MTVDKELSAQIESLSRSEFRATVNAERRATLAIGVLILHWGQFESSLGWMIKESRERNRNLGLSEFDGDHPNDIAGKMGLLRRLIRPLTSNDEQLREFDRISQTIGAASKVRDDLAHGAMGPGNSTGTADGVYVLCMPPRRAKKTTKLEHLVITAYNQLPPSAL